MAYKKPICVCGHDLVIRQQAIDEFETNITTKGVRCKNSKKVWSINVFNNERLYCTKCQNQYRIGLDKKSRILRGEHIF